MGAAIGFDNRADAEETVRQRRAIAHNNVNGECEWGARPEKARARAGAATQARMRTGAQRPLIVRMMR